MALRRVSLEMRRSGMGGPREGGRVMRRVNRRTQTQKKKKTNRPPRIGEVVLGLGGRGEYRGKGRRRGGGLVLSK